MENRRLIGRESLAKRWDMKVSTVIKYENEGIITRVPGIPSPKYNIEEIMKVEGSEINPLSPLERRRLEREVDYWKERYLTKYNVTLEEWNHDKDHVHLLFRGSPNTEISKFLNAYKSASSRLIKKEYPIIKKQLWKEYFWSRSYCLLTTGGAPIEIVRKYIENQGVK